MNTNRYAGDSTKFIVVSFAESEKINYYDTTGSTCKATRHLNSSATEAIIKYNSSLGTPDFLSTLSGIRGPYDRLGISTIATYEWKSS
tara:strand:- start:1868 stop:2131 length:264 start_codon:yes stop_codon:yes gene_type:complete